MAKYPLILALHEADQEASILLEDKDGNKHQPDPKRDQTEGCDFQEAEPISGPESDEDAEPGENETEE